MLCLPEDREYQGREPTYGGPAQPWRRDCGPCRHYGRDDEQCDDARGAVQVAVPNERDLPVDYADVGVVCDRLGI